MTAPNAPSVRPGFRTRCAMNSCRAELWSDEYDEHLVEQHYGHDELVEAAKAYIVLRDAVIAHLNPAADDVAEVAIIETAIVAAAEALDKLGCNCTVFDVEDNAPCVRCAALGRLGDQVVSR